jgi:RimJ/RimL family protein N-acetyltransferase
MLRAEHVYLRPVRRDDLSLLVELVNNVAYLTEFNFFSLNPPTGMEKQFEEDGLLGQEDGTLLVVTCENEEVVGEVSYRQVRYGPGNTSVAYDLGIVLAPEYRGKGWGVQAQQLITEYLFSAYPIMRVEASTDVTNAAEMKALEKAGFTREGVLRQAQWRGGAWHDLVVFSKLRGE